MLLSKFFALFGIQNKAFGIFACLTSVILDRYYMEPGGNNPADYFLQAGSKQIHLTGSDFSDNISGGF